VNDMRGLRAARFRMMPFGTVLAVAGIAVVPLRGEAAVRKCGEFVAFAGEDGTELAAKQKALRGWAAAASRLGPAYTLWRNAVDRSLSCLVLQNGMHRCQAFGRPCGIAQNPNALPPGTIAPPVTRKEIRT